MTQKQKKNLKQTSNYGLKNKLNKRRFNLRVLNKILFFALFVLVVGYLACVNDIAIQGFVLTDLRQNIKELNKKNSNLELKIMMLESYDNVSKRASRLKMVKADDVDFMQVTPSEVARR